MGFMSEEDLVKTRDIVFKSYDADEHPAQHAYTVLARIKGIMGLEVAADKKLRVSYDIRFQTLDKIEDFLQQADFYLDNSLFYRIKRALYAFTEENQRRTLGVVDAQLKNQTREVYLSRYKKLPHGCRDDRPKHLRDYH